MKIPESALLTPKELLNAIQIVRRCDKVLISERIAADAATEKAFEMGFKQGRADTEKKWREETAKRTWHNTQEETMSELDSRYEIGCTCCGIQGFEGHIDRALASARRIKQLHQDCGLGSLEVFDRMAHYGQPKTYRPDGTVKSRLQV